ncbi:hypothetical protein EJ02DRAFT_454773 [Clathrospora elynae]|uniref:RING-type domain-containing protein n=1 Tax=Clathrospora elynae TaxID=706981 RepID=A0A6A5STQ0_9PLEO|nr:hypothetical protein EJ02DRAFT_454773 [Clathrospora elynae]
MGTLTADCPRLDAHCPHKLATSCRLTSTLNCCACADVRAHSRTYRVYIDGVGFVQRGTRWQGYCWFCKEFWSNRLAATDPPLETSQTRIPEIPDQAEFLERWWEFHQGYRVAKLADGTEQHIAVIGEPFKEVSPGFLPRTLDQLRAGVENDARRPENRLRRRRLSSEEERPEQPPIQSLEDALDSLIREVDELEVLSPEELIAVEASVTPQIQEEPPEPPQLMARREAELQRARERFARVFGSREELQQDDYESPLTQMYGRAYDRYRQAEERRSDGTDTAPALDGLSAPERREIEEQLLWGVMRESQSLSESLEPESEVWSYAPRPPQVDLFDSVEGEYSAGTEALSVNRGGATMTDRWFLPSEVENLRAGSMHAVMLRMMELETTAQHRPRSPPRMSLDNQPDRPAPKSDEEMTRVLACQVCYQQVADVAVLPCGHMVMCQWCADVVVPVRHGHIPARPTKCPMCRKLVKQRVKIHTG